ncbi:MAG: glycoside hydrolase family 30 protein [Polyangiaceae bacterium]|nr:glycoside hydrolase family 30 protein [Polyangiaceae bacterium]
MNRLSLPITAIWLALSVAACGSESSSVSENGGSGGSSAGAGGSVTGGGSSDGTTGGSSVGTTGGSGGIPAGTTGGSSVSGSGGIPIGTTGGSSVGGSGGIPIGTTGGSSVGNTGGSSVGTTGGSSVGGNGGGPSGGRENTGGRSSGDTGGQTGTTGGGTSGGSGTGSGGATGGAGTGGGAPTELALITSAENAYWKTEGQVTEATSGTANLTVDENTKHQLWSGFGGTFNEMGWDALSVVSTEIANAIRLLFDPQDGAAFVYGRIPLGASDYSMSWYTLDDTAGDYEMADFSIARDQEKLIPYIKEALKVRPDLRLWASPWVVPSWMMSGRAMKSDAQTLGAHALYMARFVEEYAKEGLNIEAIHPQNEPGYGRVSWTQSLLIDFMKTYLGPTLAQRNLTTEVWCGTMSKDPDDTNIAKATANDPEAMKWVKGFGVQWNLEAAVATLAAKAPVMQTEHRCGNYNFSAQYWDQSRYDPNKAQNDHLYGEESWQLIRDWIVAGVSSYCAWNMVLDTVGKSLDGWPQNALLVVDRSAKKLIPTAAYYVFRHFSRYIAPGSTRIGVTGSNDAFAFKNPDGSVVTQVYNSGGSSKKMTVKIGSAFYQFDVPAHGWATLVAP